MLLAQVQQMSNLTLTTKHDYRFDEAKNLSHQGNEVIGKFNKPETTSVIPDAQVNWKKNGKQYA